MAGFQSQDDMINEVSTNGKFFRSDWQKSTFATTAHTAGLWYSLFRGGGNPSADTILGTGTNLAFQALTDATTGATGIPHGGNVGGYKVLLNAAAQTAAATTAPCVLMLVDLLGFYNITSVTTTGAQTLNNTVTLPRYTTGAGVQAFLTPSTVMGAATPNISIGYTNSAGTASRATPATLPIGNTAAAVTSVVYSGTGAGKYGPFMPLQAGDAGIRSVQSINLSASYVSGVLNLVLCKPLMTLPVTTIGVTAERDLVNQFMSMPAIYDGACLAWLMLAGAATPSAPHFQGILSSAGSNMALVGNRSVLLKSPGRWLNGGHGILRSAFNQPGMARSAAFSPIAAIPNGHLAPSAWVLPKRSGGMSSVNYAGVTVSVSGLAVGGITTTGSASMALTFADAVGQLIASAAGSCTVTITTNLPLPTASISGAGSAALSVLTNTPLLGARASGIGSASFVLSGSLIPYAVGQMSGTTAELGLTVAGITNAVWSAPLVNYQESGTAGKALAAASSGGVDYEALGLAVWNSVSRTLTAGDAPTTAEIVAAIEAAVVPVNIKAVNDVQVKGDGTAGNPWGPA